MKISYENLNLLKSNEYEEYLKLKSKDYNGETIGCLAWIFLHFLIASIVSMIYTMISNAPNSDVYKIKSSFFTAFIVYIFPCYFVSLSITAIVGTGLNKIFDFRNLFKNISQKRNSYQKLNELDLYFEYVKNDLENQLNNYVDGELNSMIQKIKENINNEAIFSNLAKTLRFNHRFVKESSDILKSKNIFVNYKEKLKRNDIWFEDESKKMEANLIEKTKDEESQKQTKVYSRKENSKSSIGSINLKSRNKGKDEFSKNSQTERIIQPQPQSQNSESDFGETNTTEITENSLLQENEKSEKQGQLNLFETEERTQQIKLPSKQKLFKPRKIKANSEFWDALNKKKISIGKKGELLVLEYERKRIFSEEGEEFVNHLEHTSVIQGDGMGYDILSIENGGNIFIEVKTTTGSFRSNLIFTKNELEAMKYYGNQYYLYRVYDYDGKNQTGNLRIFKGKEHITSIFNFNPHTFILEEK